MLQCSKNVDCSPTLYSTTRIDDFKDVELIQDTNGGCSALKRFKIRWDPSMNLSPAKQSCAESRPSQWTLFTQTKERKKKKTNPRMRDLQVRRLQLFTVNDLKRHSPIISPTAALDLLRHDRERLIKDL